MFTGCLERSARQTSRLVFGLEYAILRPFFKLDLYPCYFIDYRPPASTFPSKHTIVILPSKQPTLIQIIETKNEWLS